MILEKGLASIDSNTIKFESDVIRSIFLLGFDCIQNGIDSKILETILEAKISIILNNERILESEIFEITLLKKIMPISQEKNFMKFLDF